MEKAVESRDVKLKGDLCNNHWYLHNRMSELFSVETLFKNILISINIIVQSTNSTIVCINYCTSTQ